jgi:hypothetical protein
MKKRGSPHENEMKVAHLAAYLPHAATSAGAGNGPIGNAHLVHVALEGQTIVTLELIGGPMNRRRVLAPSASRRLFFDGFDGDAGIGRRPLLTAGPAVSLQHLGRYDAEFVYDCTRTAELILVMRWTAREDDR